jgi:hypothetical protein
MRTPATFRKAEVATSCCIHASTHRTGEAYSNATDAEIDLLVEHLKTAEGMAAERIQLRIEQLADFGRRY